MFYVLYRMVMLPMALGDPIATQTTQFLHFYILLTTFVVSEHRDIKFIVQVDHDKSQLRRQTILERGWSRHVTHLNFYPTPLKYLEWLKLETSNCVLWLGV